MRAEVWRRRMRTALRVGGLDAEVRDRIVDALPADLPEDVRARARRLPAAYLAELRRAMEVEGVEGARVCLESLERTRAFIEEQ